ncbi:I78 family peptidase inhibitor [Paracoccus zhejiangensis]|uniref:I78 family peptidase inhibitor n=1 Tax=Paracoccus zhejiangensis TaxID=1077935 RepID=UPI001E46EEE7|nr:I78 family peptidase inhibitor [Paracoccus zhejiangensis]
MNILKPLGLAVLPLALAACAPPPTQVIVPIIEETPVTEADAPGDTCGATTYQQYVGQQSPQISLPAGTVIRHYRTGDPITMDHASGRINFEYDRTGKLVKVACG